MEKKQTENSDKPLENLLQKRKPKFVKSKKGTRRVHHGFKNCAGIILGSDEYHNFMKGLVF